MEVTTFRGLKFTAPKEHTTLENVLMDIRSDKWKDKIRKCRTDLKYKDWLPCFTPTGKFSHRSIKGLETYNGIICLDVDYVPFPEILKNDLRCLDWVHAAFITPSGRGLKVLVKTNATIETYKDTEIKVSIMFTESTGAVRDNHCKDIARIQFISHDPHLYYNPDSVLVNHVADPIELEIL